MKMIIESENHNQIIKLAYTGMFYPCFFDSEESRFRVNVLKTNKTDKIINFDMQKI